MKFFVSLILLASFHVNAIEMPLGFEVRLGESLRHAGMTRARLVTMLGYVSQSSVQKILDGEAGMPLFRVGQAALLLGVDFMWLLDGGNSELRISQRPRLGKFSSVAEAMWRNEFGSRLRAQLGELNLSQREAARSIQMSETVMPRIVNAKKAMSPAHFLAFVRKYDVDAEKLLGLEDFVNYQAPVPNCELTLLDASEQQLIEELEIRGLTVLVFR